MKPKIPLYFRNPFLTEWDKRHARRTAHARLTLWVSLALLGVAGVVATIAANLGPVPVGVASLATLAACVGSGFYFAKWQIISH